MLRFAADALDVLGLGEPVFRVFQRLQAATFKDQTSDPLLPPPLLRVLTAGTAAPEVFIAQGRQWAEFLSEVARAHGFQDGQDRSVLEFGCGSGRAARWWIEAHESNFYGCDVQSRLIRWCSENLAGHFSKNDLLPPLRFESEAFDLLYAISVFTHLREDLAGKWLSELARVTKPGGLALITFHDESSSGAESVIPTLKRDGFAVRRGGANGGNLLSVFYSAEGFSRRAASNWETAAVFESNATGGGQAVVVLRKK